MTCPWGLSALIHRSPITVPSTGGERKHREVKSPGEGHTAAQWVSLNSIAGSPVALYWTVLHGMPSTLPEMCRLPPKPQSIRESPLDVLEPSHREPGGS